MVRVQGNGNLVSKRFEVSSYLRLHVAVKGVTELIHGDEEKVEVELDENLLDYVEVQNAGSTLYVSTEGKLRVPEFTVARIRIYFRQLDHLVIRCHGGQVSSPELLTFVSPLDLKVQSEGNVDLKLRAPSLKVLAQMQGDLRLAGPVDRVEIKTQSEGNLWARELRAKELTLKNMSEGNVEVYASEQIALTHMGSGDVHYYGDARLTAVKQYGDGALKHCS